MNGETLPKSRTPPLPAAPLGAGPGVVRLVRLGLQLQRLGRKFLRHPKVLRKGTKTRVRDVAANNHPEGPPGPPRGAGLG